MFHQNRDLFHVFLIWASSNKDVPPRGRLTYTGHSPMVWESSVLRNQLGAVTAFLGISTQRSLGSWKLLLCLIEQTPIVFPVKWNYVSELIVYSCHLWSFTVMHTHSFLLSSSVLTIYSMSTFLASGFFITVNSNGDRFVVICLRTYRF